MRKIIILFILITSISSAQEKRFLVVGQLVSLEMTKNAFLNLYKNNSLLTISGAETNSIFLSDKKTTEIYAICDFENNKLVVVNKYWERYYGKSTINLSLALYDILAEIVGSESVALVSTFNYSQPGEKAKGITFEFSNSDRSVNIFIDEKKQEVYIYENYRRMPKY
ncbi:MAG: hypothetical protein ACYCVH_11100 [Ignavibacteriaceae bacterium]